MNRPVTPGARRYQEALDRGDMAAKQRMDAARADSLKKTLEKKRVEAAGVADVLAAEGDERRMRKESEAVRDLADRGEIVIDPDTGDYTRVYEPPED